MSVEWWIGIILVFLTLAMSCINCLVLPDDDNSYCTKQGGVKFLCNGKRIEITNTNKHLVVIKRSQQARSGRAFGEATDWIKELGPLTGWITDDCHEGKTYCWTVYDDKGVPRGSCIYTIPFE